MAKARIFGLDLLRALAIGLVLLSHAFFFPFSIFEGNTQAIWGGIWGVELFFALSGFLIGRILLRLTEQGITWGRLKRFWQRRWWRTLPNYYLILLLNTILWGLLGQLDSEKVAFWLFLQNWASPHPNAFREAWSLSIEEWFYLSSPILLWFVAWLLGKLSVKWRFLLSLMGIFLLAQSLRIVFIRLAPTIDLDSAVRQVVLCRLDAPVWGLMAAWVSRFYPQKCKNWAKAAFVCGCLMLGLGYMSWYAEAVLWQSLSLTLTDLGFALWLPWACRWSLPSGALKKGIQHTSLISYSLYLVHMQIAFRLTLRLVPWFSWWQIWIIYLILSIGLASLLYKYLEKPILDWRDRRF